jgi:hypothetical protein
MIAIESGGIDKLLLADIVCAAGAARLLRALPSRRTREASPSGPVSPAFLRFALVQAG